MAGPRIKSGAGFVPAISFNRAPHCQIERDCRIKPGNDKLESRSTHPARHEAVT